MFHFTTSNIKLIFIYIFIEALITTANILKAYRCLSGVRCGIMVRHCGGVAVWLRRWCSSCGRGSRCGIRLRRLRRPRCSARAIRRARGGSRHRSGGGSCWTPSASFQSGRAARTRCVSCPRCIISLQQKKIIKKSANMLKYYVESFYVLCVNK